MLIRSTQTLALLGILSLGSQIYAREQSSLTCIPEVSRHAIQALEIARTNGLVVERAADGQKVMLGKDIIPSSVEISGIDGKNTATVRFYFWPDTILTTFIYGVEDGICSIHDQKQQLFNPEYRLIQ